MLSIGRVGPANAGNYQSAVVAGVEDYYAGGGDAPGVWVGRADLVGAVTGSLATAVDAKLLLEAKCARDGTRLGKTTVSERSVTAFDLTFSVPKSVSILYALGDEQVAAEIEAAHAVAVEEAITSMSPRITTRNLRVELGGIEPLRGCTCCTWSGATLLFTGRFRVSCSDRQ
ncbi:MAG: relaxase domain-containing protein [Ilumatobacteraceae bacterium]